MKKVLFLLFIVFCFSNNIVNAMEKKNVKTLNTIYGQGEKNPYSKFFTGQTYLQRLVF